MSLIKTIEDDDLVPDYEEEDSELEEEGGAQKPLKRVGKAPFKKQPKAAKKDPKKAAPEEWNSEFSFDADYNGAVSTAWDFAFAKKALKNQKTSSSLDEKISKKLQDLKKKGNDSEDEDEESEGLGEEDDSGDDDREENGHEFEGGSEDEDGDEVEGGEENEADSSDEDEEEDHDEDEAETESDDDEEEEEDEEEEDEEEKERQKQKYFSAAPDTELVESFVNMNLSRPIIKAITALGFSKPTPIQAKAIPLGMEGRDICASAVTGSGKTAAFLIPILERLLFRPKEVATSRVLILTPTRELAIQCHSVAAKLSKFTDIHFSLVVGGLNMKTQEADLRRRADVLIATPGRLIDHLQNSPSFDLDSIEILVLDEADRMLEEGFRDALTEIVKSCPRGRQTMLFSASMTDEINDLIRLSLNHPVRLFVDKSTDLASNLVQEFVRIRKQHEEDREAVLVGLCKRTFKTECIVFFTSKKAVHRAKIIFGLFGLKAAELHGSLSQLHRLESLEKFRDGEVDYLLCTDVAARGLDIAGITTVINMSMPHTFKQYIHRVGRTARAGRNGRSVTLVGEADRKLLKEAVKNAKDKVKKRTIPPEVILKYSQKINGMEKQITEIMREEKEDNLLQKAEMEATKAKNLIDHKDEIMSRPAKTWFQSQAEKKGNQERANELYEQAMGLESKKRRREEEEEEMKKKIKRGKYDGMSRAKRRRLMTMEDTKDSMAETAKGIKKIKKDFKPKRLSVMGEKRVTEGSRPSKSGFTSELTSIGKKSVQQMRKGNQENGGRDRKAAGAGGKKKEGKEKPKEKESDNPGGRKHAIKKPRKSFKSKGRFKRRK